MEDVSLSDAESHYYGSLFLCCDEEKTGKIPILKASELFSSANISHEKILEITSLAGIPNTALHVSRVQFYSCLKLIAAHQYSLPLRQELFAASVQLPLPFFSSTYLSANEMGMAQHYQQQHPIPPPPTCNRKNSLNRFYERSDTNTLSRRNSFTAHPTERTTINSTDTEMEQKSSCEGEGGFSVISGHNKDHRRGVSPEAWSTNSDSPTPTNSVAERPWAKETLWHGLLGDEHRQLLGTEEESSDRHSSDEETEAEFETVYQITPEQREYYFKQFKAVQHGPNDLLSGQVARIFFEKSRIPIEELRHIWRLCDVTRDGALTLAEFTAAMHLVVLRRNNIPLPAALPVCLHPNVLQHTTMSSQADPPEADLLHLNDDDEEDNTDNTIISVKATMHATVGASVGVNVVENSAFRTLNEKSVINISTLSASSQTNVSSGHGTDEVEEKPLTPPTIPAPPPLKLHTSSKKSSSPSAITPLQLHTISNSPKTDEVSVSTPSPLPIICTKDVQPNQWTKFNESPTSNVSSPGPKPVNFDMQRTAQAVVSDPQILHPVPLRVTPIGGVLATAPTATEKQTVESHDSAVAVCESSLKSSISSTNNNGSSITGVSQYHRDTLQNNDLRAIQRPQAKRLPIKNIGAIPPPPQRECATGGNVMNTIADLEILGAFAGGCVINNLSVPMVVNKKVLPPLPPNRPHRHGRSSSLDLNKFKVVSPSGKQPEIVSQASFDFQTSTGFADFTNFPDAYNTTSVNNQQSQQMRSLSPQNLTGHNFQTTSETMPPIHASLQSYQRVSAFEVYRKPNTLRNFKSPTLLTVRATISGTSSMGPVAIPTPFGSVAATAMTVATSLPNSELYEKRVNSISETLRHVSFKQEHNNKNIIEVLRHIREQNNLLLRLCNDLSDELLTVQGRKEEMKLKLEAATSAKNSANLLSSVVTAAVGHSGDNSGGIIRTSSSISVPVTANITGGSGGSVHSNF